ncbi:MAG: FAD-dependent oxidoreductase [Christensenellaceae bacterium]|jgi:thioredoxin reductase (NADPH)|nr:FAD-dependent oxidoreductase [Christensenellaceae bacterium]
MYDVIIIGGGPAGLTAAIYARRAEKSVLVLTGGAAGGAAALTPFIENFPSHLRIGGAELTDVIKTQAVNFGAEFRDETVTDVCLRGGEKTATTAEDCYVARNIIIATGTKIRDLGVPNEEKLVGKGVSYCAVCDGNFFRRRAVCVVGGGNTALTDALYLAGLCSKVYLIHRRNEFRASPALVSEVLTKPNVEVVYNSKITTLVGIERLEGVTVQNVETGAEQSIEVKGLFVAVGSVPNSELFKSVETTNGGAIITNSQMQTNIPGIFAIGDVRDTPLRQIITACADGAVAATFLLK